MTTSRPSPSLTATALRITRGAGAAVTLLPRGLAAFAVACAGNGGSARSLLRVDAGPAAPRPGAVRVAGQAVATVLLGALCLVLAAVVLLAVARGLFYGLVDQGPYDHSWGGPGRAGAWLAHFAVATPCVFAGVAALYGVARMQERLTAPLRGERRPGWVLPSVFVCCAAGALFVVAFLRQLP
ncbi:hypothetical protein [Streptomyces sp. NBC_01012]|uniref:hypothetical protein n=1 Tax=Streptomyces sp. NBC_01012 TaxID=2903717 RepID=UPI00386943FA|nr:hypothetical protein OG623_18390 [Streptomyces sp. NBC_01012]